MNENLNKHCETNPEDTACRKELIQLGLDLGIGTVKPGWKKLTLEADLEERVEAPTRGELSRRASDQARLDLQDFVEVDRVAIMPYEADLYKIKPEPGKPLTADDYRRMHKKDPFTGERLI